MREIKKEHYIDTIVYSIDMIIKNLKTEIKQKVDKLDIGITSEQLIVLDTISTQENMYQQKLSDIMLKDKSNTTRILNVLEEKGLITRKASRINNRLVYILNITKDGKKLLKENLPVIKKFITDIFQNITDDEIELLRSLSKKFQKDLSQASKK